MKTRVPLKFRDYILEFQKAEDLTAKTNLEHVGIGIFNQTGPAGINPVESLAKVAALVERELSATGNYPIELACITFTAYAYVALRLLGIPAEIVIGDLIDGDGDGYFNTDPNILLSERNPDRSLIGVKQNIHCWLQVSPDTLLDFTATKYIAKNEPHLLGSDPRLPFHIEPLMDSRWVNQARYKPMLLGAGILRETNQLAILDYTIEEFDLNNLPIGSITEDPIVFFHRTQKEVIRRQVRMLEEAGLA